MLNQFDNNFTKNNDWQYDYITAQLCCHIYRQRFSQSALLISDNGLNWFSPIHGILVLTRTCSWVK